MIKLKGYTLAEVLLVVCLIGVLSMAAPPLLLQTVRFIRLNTAKAEIQRDVRQGLDLMNRYLRQGKASSLVIDSLSGNPPYSRLTFDTVSNDGYRFYQDKKTLFMQTRKNGVWYGPKVISRNLRFLAFTYPRTDDDQIISISITTEKETYQGGTKALQLSIEKVRIMNP